MASDGVKYRLGLDIGTNSIGWAAIRLDESGEPYGVLDIGVRIFQDGRNPKDGTSNAVKRRIPRGQRRRRDRYLKRRSELMEALVEFGLMPADEDERKALAGLAPYTLRTQALDHPLKPYELGRALFHLDQRRGFKSNRKMDGGGDNDDEAKIARAEINALRARIEASGARTLGEFLARRLGKGKPVRARPGLNLYPDRAMYEAEFDAIRTSQAQHHALNDEGWDSLRDIIFFQRPLEPVDPGWCQLEQGEKRAPRALPVFQEFRMLQEINNLKLRVDIGPERPLNKGEREAALRRLRSGRNIDLKKPTRDLGLSSGTSFNLAAGGRKTVKGDEISARLIKKKEKGKKEQTLFGDGWLGLSLCERNEIVRLLLDAEGPEIRRKAREDWGSEDTQAEVLADVSLPDGYGNLSEKAIDKLLPYLEKGRVYSDAVTDAGYPHHSDFRNAEAHEKLPYYGEVLVRDVVGADPEKDPVKDSEPARYGRIGNPTVHIGLSQLRRVVNRLIEVYGKPQEIVVELARELKMNREQKQDFERQQQKGTERNERLRKDLESAEKPVTPDVLRKLRLWEEQGPIQARLCPYSGNPLSFEIVVSSQTEIDHILPFSCTLDDSPANKVVCIAAANRDKGNRSPHEAFGHSPPGYDYQAILSRAHGLPYNKRRRFQPDAMEWFEGEQGFLDRQLNETRYLSRTARTYLAHLYDERVEGTQRVRVIPGRMTALLRRGWGLEGILRVSEQGEKIGKQRDDHRHHAIDAFVVANTTPKLLQQFAHAAGASHDTEERLRSVAGNMPPWEGFYRDQLKPFLDRMVISHKPDHGTRDVKGRTTTGQLHNETAYGLIEFLEDGVSKVVTRRKVSDFKKRGDLEIVRDSALRTALMELWDSVGGKATEFAQQAAREGVLLNGRCQRVRRVRVVDEQRVIPVGDNDGEPYKGYLPGGNEFADVWQMPPNDGSWQMVVVPTFDANQPGFDPIVRRPHPAAKLIARVYKNDMCAIETGADRKIMVVRKMDGQRLTLFEHHASNDQGRTIRIEPLRKRGFRKVGVDEIGRVRDPGPSQP